MKKYRSICPLASGLDIFGDKWSLLIIRDFFGGKTSYSEFLRSPEKISTNILSNRLKLLEEQGIIALDGKSARTGKSIYSLTEKGRKLFTVIDAIAEWSLEYIDGTQKILPVNVD